jgi:hypothetical protein
MHIQTNRQRKREERERERDTHTHTHPHTHTHTSNLSPSLSLSLEVTACTYANLCDWLFICGAESRPTAFHKRVKMLHLDCQHADLLPANDWRGIHEHSCAFMQVGVRIQPMCAFMQAVGVNQPMCAFMQAGV